MIDSWWINADLLTHVDMSGQSIEAGDYVITGPEKKLAVMLQKHSGLWEEGQEEVRFSFLFLLSFAYMFM